MFKWTKLNELSKSSGLKKYSINVQCISIQHNYPGFVDGLYLLNTSPILATDKQIWLLEIQIWGANWLVAKMF